MKAKRSKLTAAVQNTKYVFGIVSESLSSGRIICEALVCAIRSLLPLILSVLSKIAIDRSSESYQSQDNPYSVFSFLVALVALSVGVMAVESIFQIILKKMRAADIYNISSTIQRKALSKFSTLDQQFFDNSNTLNIISRGSAFNEDEIFSLYIGVIIVFTNTISAIGYAVVLTNFNALLCFVAIIVELVRFMSLQKAALSNDELLRSITTENRIRDYFLDILKSPMYAKETRIYGSTDFLWDKYSTARDRSYSLTLQVHKQNSRRDLLLSVVFLAIEGGMPLLRTPNGDVFSWSQS